mmetsp:Transcript_30991/g.72006  ORF Transcript_30991/g.72006 Transcript_30991/m.72006 type:complete len:211 (-) Transcript_30991:947-1579(-)
MMHAWRALAGGCPCSTAGTHAMRFSVATQAMRPCAQRCWSRYSSAWCMVRAMQRLCSTARLARARRTICVLSSSACRKGLTMSVRTWRPSFLRLQQRAAMTFSTSARRWRSAAMQSRLCTCVELDEQPQAVERSWLRCSQLASPYAMQSPPRPTPSRRAHTPYSSSASPPPDALFNSWTSPGRNATMRRITCPRASSRGSPLPLISRSWL